MPYAIEFCLESTSKISEHFLHCRVPFEIGTSNRHWMAILRDQSGLILGKTIREEVGLNAGDLVEICIRTSRLVKVNKNRLPGGWEYPLPLHIVAAEDVADIVEQVADHANFIAIGGDSLNDHFQVAEVDLHDSKLPSGSQILIANVPDHCVRDVQHADDADDDSLEEDHFDEIVDSTIEDRGSN